MKKFIPTILFPFFLFSCMHAQELNYGLKAGAQLTSATHISDAKNAILYHVGGFVEMTLANRLSLQAELLFSAQGVDDSESDDYKQRNLYLQIPVLAKFQVWGHLSVHAGIQAGWLMSAHLKIDDGDIKESYDNKEDYKELDFGMLAGAEYLVTNNIGLGARANWSVSKLFTDFDNPRQQVFQAFLTYRFNAGKF